MRNTLIACTTLLVALACGCAGCNGTAVTGAVDDGQSSAAYRTYPLDTLPQSTVTIDEHTFRVWLARDFDDERPGIVSEGLMFVRSSEMADDQGMLFVFDDERLRGFWMRNTVTPLDIAFARFDGTIVKIWQMPPLTLETFSSIEPAMYALEVKQGTFAQLGIKEGDQLEVPLSVFDTAADTTP